MSAQQERTVFAGVARPPSSWRSEPGLALRSADRERYRVPGGGAVVLALEPGDRLSITDPEGAQPGELVAFDAEGRNGLGALAAADHGTALGLQTVLADGSESAARVRFGLLRRGLDLRQARAHRLFSAQSAPGERVQFTAQSALTLVLSALGEAMEPQEQSAPTDLMAEIHRFEALPPSLMPLPDPLAEPRLDLRVDARTARAYEVKAGEYIQIIDVAGRECSDFICLDARKLQQGIERLADMTTTRSLIGHAYGAPGLAAKFFDRDQHPMVEVIQDTVGRHDAFGLACSARYYDEAGYPGHVNCSENSNLVLAPFGIQPRTGWEAVNFFYNTRIDEQNVYYLDEPWSRPGDYVLLRAQTDLVCVSTACPDDISPANGWTPTDIHVRVYSPEKTFRKAVAYRMTPDAEPQLTRETGFHPRTSQLTRNFTEYRGFWLPNHFHNEGPIEEYWACRQGVIAMDLSALRKFEVYGPDAETLLQTALTRNVRKLAVGQVVYSALCYESGGMIDDGTLFRLGPDTFRWIGGDDYGGIWLRQLAEKLGLKAFVKSSTDQLHNISVQGPKSRDVLKEVVWTRPDQPSMEEVEWFRFTIGRVGDHNGIPLVVSRTGYTGELGYEVWCHPKHAPAVWDAVMAGRRAARHRAARPRRPRPAAHRGRADLLRPRVRRPDRPLRGRHRLHRAAEEQGRRLRRQGGADPAQGAGAPQAGRPGARGQRGRRARRLRACRPCPGRRGDQRHALAADRKVGGALPDRRGLQRPRHRGRGWQARRPPEADSGAGRALSLL